MDLTKSYNYADYLTWEFPEYGELFRGQFVPKPTPWTAHQRVLGNLTGLVANHAKGKLISVFHRPFDVRLPHTADASDAAVTTVVQPDLCVFLDRRQLDERGAVGAPAWIIEVVSAVSLLQDTQLKFALYAQFGVREYWLVSPGERAVIVCHLAAGRYEVAGIHQEAGPIPSLTLPGLALEWADVFEGMT